MIKILVADDHAIVREGLKQIVRETADMEVAGEAADGGAVMKLVSGEDWDVILLDIGMPGRSGIDILKEVKTVKPEIPVLMLSMYPEEQYAVRALKAGASGYLTKESVPNELISAIRKVSAGGKYVSTSLAEKLAYDLVADGEKPLHEALSDREYQVLCMIAGGETVKDIADKLSLSIKTISTYRSRVLEKMRMKNNAELMHYAIKHNLGQ
jgi:two-component system invasion response regulator UvrY